MGCFYSMSICILQSSAQDVIDDELGNDGEMIEVFSGDRKPKEEDMECVTAAQFKTTKILGYGGFSVVKEAFRIKEF